MGGAVERIQQGQAHNRNGAPGESFLNIGSMNEWVKAIAF